MGKKSSVFGLQSSAKRRFAQLALIAILALTFLGASDSATRFNALGHGMICPCGCNQILLECNHVGCQYSDRMRGELQAMIDKGQADEAITQAFVLKYGNTILAAPTKTGFNLVAWVVPFVVLGLAIFFAALVVRRWRVDDVLAPAAAPGGVPDFEHYREQARRETEL